MTPAFESVCVVGLGYVGLPTAAILASRGLAVLGVDVNERAVGLINQGRIHIQEPDLDIMVNGAVALGKLSAATTPAPADAFIIAVPTPFTEGHRPDLSFLEDAVRAVAPVLKAGDLIVLESTLPVGTTERACGWLSRHRPDLRFPGHDDDESDIFVAHSPERVLPGRVLLEMVRNDRVIGGITPQCAERATDLYRTFVDGECLITSARVAELVKLAENSFRDVNIAFANELSMVCDRLGVSVWEVIPLANRHPRVNVLKPGPGVGGHCIAVDPWFLVDAAPDLTPLIQAARSVNDRKPGHVVAQVKSAIGARTDVPVACLGLSYKADIDDVRESPAVEIVRQLAASLEGPIRVVEPHLSGLPAALDGLDRVTLTDLEEALDRSEVVVLLVDHRRFLAIDRALLHGKAIVDTRGVWL